MTPTQPQEPLTSHQQAVAALTETNLSSLKRALAEAQKHHKLYVEGQQMLGQPVETNFIQFVNQMREAA